MSYMVFCLWTHGFICKLIEVDSVRYCVICLIQADPKSVKPLKEEVPDPGPSGRRPDISLQIPPRPVGFGCGRSGKGLLQSQGSAKGSTLSGASFSRGLSFKKKGVIPDGERSSLLESDNRRPPESPIMANLKSMFAWQRCTSLPVRPETNLSPSATTPLSARMSNERPKPIVCFHEVPNPVIR